MSSDRARQRWRARSYELDRYLHLNNGAYVNWFEDAREGFLRVEDRDYDWYPEHCKAWFVVVKLDCDFVSAALAHEEVEISTRLVHIGRSSVVFRQAIRRLDDGRLRARARVVMCFADLNDRSTPVPEDFRARFSVAPEGDRWLDDEGGDA